MKVANQTIRPPSANAHLLWVPGRMNARRARSSPSSPMIWVSSPRITSGTPSAPASDRPGTKWITRPASVSWRRSALASSALPAGQAQYGTSTQPWREVIMPDAITGRSGAWPSQAPASRSRTASNPPPSTLRIPAAAARLSRTAPAASIR